MGLTMVLEFTLSSASVLKRTVEAMKELCKEINFDCSEKGIEVQSMDSSHVALVSLILREKAFLDYKCDRSTTLGMNMEAVSKVMKMCNPTDVLKLSFSVKGDLGDGNVMLKPRESDKIEEKVELNVKEPVVATFALAYLVKFAKAAPLSGLVELGVGADM